MADVHDNSTVSAAEIEIVAIGSSSAWVHHRRKCLVSCLADGRKSVLVELIEWANQGGDRSWVFGELASNLRSGTGANIDLGCQRLRTEGSVVDRVRSDFERSPLFEQSVDEGNQNRTKS